jgi:hypothetical protein
LKVCPASQSVPLKPITETKRPAITAGCAARVEKLPKPANTMNPDESQRQTPAEHRSERNAKALFIAFLATMCFCHPPFILILAIGWLLRLYGFLRD